ncbi:DUF4062 domain-containing protein [Sphingobium naphthae]|nr:DUF4062 domain-containing protein [Sphingobium naphthae]
MDIKLIRAFIASPGGLEAERRAAYAAAEEINRSVARSMGGRLELIGWEETLSGNGRPQEIINADMETCDLFIGVMWTKWGSRPSADGPHTSGFEEEFELSFSRHVRTKSPLMAMFFKEVDAERLLDPGEELKKVLAFQERLRSERALLYNLFSTADEFASKVREFLATHVIRMLTPDPAPPAERSKDVSGKGSDERGSAPPDDASTGPQEARFLKDYALLVETGAEQPQAQIARLRLMANAAGKAGNDKQIIGVHDANILYDQPSDFSDSELHGLLVRGLASLDDENVPLWSWLARVEAKRVHVLHLVSIMGEDDERVGALNVMRLLGQSVKPIGEVPPSQIVAFWFKEESPDPVRIAALHYLRRQGTPEQLPSVLMEFERASKDTSDAALLAAVSIMQRQDPLIAARYLLKASFEAMRQSLLGDILAHFAELGTDELMAGLDHRAARIRARTVAVLSERSVIASETIERALDDDAAEVRFEALRARDRLGQSLSLDEAEKVMARESRRQVSFFLSKPSVDTVGLVYFDHYRAARMRSLGPQALEPLLQSQSHRDAAYRALALRKADPYASMLRANLKDGYAAYFAAFWPEGIQPEPSSAKSLLSFGTPATPADEENAKRRTLVREALWVVASQRDRNDLPLVRSVLDNGWASPEGMVIPYLKALGSDEDMKRLAKTPRYNLSGIVGEDMEADFTAAASAVLKLGGSFDAILSIEMSSDMRARLIELVAPAEYARLKDQHILSLLLSDHDGVRRIAAMKAAASLPRARIRKLLAAYKAEDGGVYYLVTHWLDLGLSHSRTLVRQIVQEKLVRS